MWLSVWPSQELFFPFWTRFFLILFAQVVLQLHSLWNYFLKYLCKVCMISLQKMENHRKENRSSVLTLSFIQLFIEIYLVYFRIILKLSKASERALVWLIIPDTWDTFPASPKFSFRSERWLKTPPELELTCRAIFSFCHENMNYFSLFHAHVLQVLR